MPHPIATWILTPTQIAALSDADVDAICPQRKAPPTCGGMGADDVAEFFAWRETLPNDQSNYWSFDGDVFAHNPTDRSEPTRLARCRL